MVALLSELILQKRGEKGLFLAIQRKFCAINGRILKNGKKTQDFLNLNK
jgi:hypothetical protein